MSALMLNLFIFDSLYNKELIQYLISLDGEFILDNCGITISENDFIYLDYYKRYISQKLELMYQKIFLRHNHEERDNIFDKKSTLHNRTHE